MLRLTFEPDSDEILAASIDPEDVASTDISATEPFLALIGRVIDHAWYLTNHRGYRDGFQLRLLDPSDRSEETRQFEVAASALWVLKVIE